MNLLGRLLKGQSEEESEAQLDGLAEPALEPNFRYEEIPDTLDLGWYWSEGKKEFQMAKISEEDRATHTYIIGASGTGKTRFLEHLILQDIVEKKGFGVIDPHGDLIEEVKGWVSLHYGSQFLSERVVLVDPTAPDFTVTFNPLEVLDGVSPAEQSAELVEVFKKIWGASWGARMEDLLRNSFIALAENRLTLLELPYLLTEWQFRDKVMERVKHPISKQYFSRFDNLAQRTRQEWIESTMNKVNAFLSDDRVRRMLSRPGSSFNLREIMDEGKVLLVKLEKGSLKDNAYLLGSLLMAKIQMAAFSRTDLPQGKRRRFYLYIDEFQDFATESFIETLGEARKYGLCLIMAHQNLTQLPRRLQDSILTNCGIQVYFRVSREDAEGLAKEGFETTAREIKGIRSEFEYDYYTYSEEWERYFQELQTLPRRCCYVKHKIEGGMIPITTPEVPFPWKVLGIEEDEYPAFLRSLPIGKKYLLPAGELEIESKIRIDEIVAEERVEPKSFRQPKKTKARKPSRRP